MYRALLTLLLVSAEMSYSANASAYVKGVYSYSLGSNGKPEFYEAHVVLPNGTVEREKLIQQLKALCTEFPRLDSYIVRVFSSSRAARIEFFSSGLGRVSASAPAWFKDEFVAEINPRAEITLFPANEGKRQVSKLGPGWCRK